MMQGKSLLEVMNSPIKARNLIAVLQKGVRPALEQEGDAPFLSFAFLYFSLATLLLHDYLVGEFSLGSAFDALTASSLLVLPIFCIASLARMLAEKALLARIVDLAVKAALVIYVLFSSIHLFCSLYFEQRITPGVIFVLAETNFAESSEFIRTYANHELLLLALFVSLPFLSRKAVSLAPIKPILKSCCLIAFLILALLGLFDLEKLSYAAGRDPSFSIIAGILEYREELKAYHSIEAEIFEPDLDGKVASASPAQENLHVLVLGESTSRAHMSLYGYHRDTSPRLAEMAAELHVFTDVISPHSHTIPVVKKLFTFANREATKEWHEYPILADIFRAAGYKTYWISNQEPYGVWSNGTSVIANRSDVQVFNNRTPLTTDFDRKDEELLPYLDQILRRDPAKNKFIVLHLMGTHGVYAKRYPAAFGEFDDQPVMPNGRDFLTEYTNRVINHYDNAVLYNDQMVAEIIERVKRENKSAYVLYLSDHGEEVYDARDFVGHTESVGNRFMVEIPFVLWTSDEYVRKNAAKVAAIEANLDRPYVTDDAIHTILDLSSIYCDGWEPSRSIIHRDFDASRERFYAGRNYDGFLRDDRSKYLIRENFRKIWAHRVNSIGKLEHSRGIFAGVELDVVFIDDPGNPRFDVNHPPAESIGLTLDAYLSSLEDPSALDYWLDIKNLGEGNEGRVAQRLSWIVKKHGLSKERLIAESPEPGALQHLSEQGFVTSYYLPRLELDAMSEAQREAAATSLAENARAAGVDAISFPGHMLAFARARIRPRLNGDVRLLTWFMDRSIGDSRDAPFLQELVNDAAVDVVLVRHSTPYDR